MGTLLDGIQSSRLLSYLTTNRLISDHQFGFLPGRSTTHQLLYIVHQWAKALDDGKGVAAVFMDFQKAFDHVWHDGLLYKLGLLGITPKSLQWLQSYLSNRSLYVNVNSSTSKDFPISAGVPQGSHLGPVLFLAFINDLPDACCSPTEIYADDTLLHLIIPKNDHTALATLQASVTNAACWANSWRGRFSPSKTVMLPIGKTARKECLENNVIMENEVINVAASHKHLGLTISTDLRWTAHIASISAKANRRAGLLRHMARYFTLHVTEKLYLSYVRPTLEYACPVWHASITAEQALCLERIQASAARRLLHADWMEPKNKLLQQLGWPALRWRRAISSITLFHQMKVAPTSLFVNQLPASSLSRSGRSLRKPEQLLLPPAHTIKFMDSFFYHSAILWNALPFEIQVIQNNQHFKSAVENHWAPFKFITTDDILSLTTSCEH